MRVTPREAWCSAGWGRGPEGKSPAPNDGDHGRRAVSRAQWASEAAMEGPAEGPAEGPVLIGLTQQSQESPG